jgi:hypothetical protein
MAIEASYYGLYLLKYLKGTENYRQHDHGFINSRADDAAGAFESERRAGATVDQAQELAMKILMDGFE